MLYFHSGTKCQLTCKIIPPDDHADHDIMYSAIYDLLLKMHAPKLTSHWQNYCLIPSIDRVTPLNITTALLTDIPPPLN